MLADPDMFGFMVMVRLPDGVLPLDKSDNQNAEKLLFTDDHAAKLQDILHYDFKVEVCSAYCVDTQQLYTESAICTCGTVLSSMMHGWLSMHLH